MPHQARWSPVASGFVAAAVLVLLLLAWKRFASWYIFGSAFTDLPGQDSLALTNRVELIVLVLITLVAGRLAGLLCSDGRWIAAVIGVSPLLLLGLALLAGFGNPLGALAWCIVVCAVGLFGAYAPAWLPRRKPDVRPRE